MRIKIDDKTEIHPIIGVSETTNWTIDDRALVCKLETHIQTMANKFMNTTLEEGELEQSVCGITEKSWYEECEEAEQTMTVSSTVGESVTPIARTTHNTYASPFIVGFLVNFFVRFFLVAHFFRFTYLSFSFYFCHIC